ncbi:MAG: phosphatidate cytidylyltransferase [Gammaproteobacteria bacterium]|nr:phosphatidate cytidylyltransferase [Gammaproteobacteria bacterium]
MLKQRVITALILAPLVIWGILELPQSWFALLLAVVVMGGFWEWSAFVSPVKMVRYLYLLGGGAVLALLQFMASPEVLGALPWVGGAWLLLASLLVICYPKISPLWQNSAPLKAIVGLLILVPMWVSVIAIQHHIGAEFVLLLMLMIWGADTGAYFAGHRWGRNKLAPAVSPGKSWEGVIGGLVAAVAVALVSTIWLVVPVEIWLFGVIAFLVAAVSVMGDLNESLFKRITGIKDSGNILPGHGGVLDRIDSLTTAAPIFYLALTVLA